MLCERAHWLSRWLVVPVSRSVARRTTGKLSAACVIGLRSAGIGTITLLMLYSGGVRQSFETIKLLFSYVLVGIEYNYSRTAVWAYSHGDQRLL
jgi:hypothetical protein